MMNKKCIFHVSVMAVALVGSVMALGCSAGPTNKTERHVLFGFNTWFNGACVNVDALDLDSDGFPSHYAQRISNGKIIYPIDLLCSVTKSSKPSEHSSGLHLLSDVYGQLSSGNKNFCNRIEFYRSELERSAGAWKILKDAQGKVIYEGRQIPEAIYLKIEITIICNKGGVFENENQLLSAYKEAVDAGLSTELVLGAKTAGAGE